MTERVPYPRPFVSRPVAVAATAALVTLAALSPPAKSAAHEGIASSSPASGSTIAEPIDAVTIDFGAEIGDSVELALVGPDDVEMASTTMVTSPTTATIEFETLAEQGTYLVQYLAPSVADGHVIVGAISFTYGSEPGPSIIPWVAFAAAAVVILAIGAWFSRRAHLRRPVDADDQAAVTL